MAKAEGSCNRAQIAGLVRQLDDRGVIALVVSAGDLLVLMHLFGKALVVGHFRHDGGDRRSESAATSSMVTS